MKGFSLLYRFLAVLLPVCSVAQLIAAEPILWAHGEWDNSGAPCGKLLSDNYGYWGEAVLTGVEYSYESAPNNPPDQYKGDRSIFGRRLLDGAFGGNWHVPVGQSQKPLVVVFDFKRSCVFTEVDLYAMRSPQNSFTIEVSDIGGAASWQQVYSKSFNSDGTTNQFFRARLASDCRGRYLRLSFMGKGISYLDEVLVWGSGEVSERYPEQINPVVVPAPPVGTRESLPGIPATRYSEAEFDEWQRGLGVKAKLPILWAATTAVQPLRAILPDADSANVAVELVVTRNESESRYLTITNPARSNSTVRLQFANPTADKIKCEILGGGVIPVERPARELSSEEYMRLFVDGTLPPDAEPEGSMQVLPFFASGQAPGVKGLIRRYLANPDAVLEFPVVTLPPGGSLIVMVRLTTDNAPPGSYQVGLQAVTLDGKSVSEVKLGVRVVDLVMPTPDLWVRAWGPGTRQFPFESRARFERDVEAVRELGVTVWDGLPEPGSKSEVFGKGEYVYHHMMMRPARLISSGFNAKIKPQDLTQADRDDVAAGTVAIVDEASRLGVPYSRWFVELWDEPGEKNAQLYGELARIIKESDPRVNIYMNPLFWRPGFAPQPEIYAELESFYNSMIDISVPIMGLVGDNLTTRELWEHPRLVNAQYLHPARRAGRGISWRSFRHGFNGWGYYCYYSPRGNPWDIKTWSSLGIAYQMVFPVADGVVITPIYEIMREGWEDYCLLTALRERGKSDLLQEVLEASAEPDADLQKLRDRIVVSFL